MLYRIQMPVCVSSLRLVGGLETLDAMEKVEVDKKDKPKVWWVDWRRMGGGVGGWWVHGWIDEVNLLDWSGEWLVH